MARRVPCSTVDDRTRADRGQAYTLEAIIAGVLILSALVFALQVTAVTPLSASTSSQHIENQQKATANGVLVAASEEGALKDAILYWNGSAGAYHGAERGTYYTNDFPDNEFGKILERAFAGRGLAVNVAIYPEDGGRPLYMINRGTPSDHGVTASKQVTLYHGDNLIDEAGDEQATTVENSSSFGGHIPDSGSSTSVYNVVRVEVTVWRM